jgi:hypothetical protein
MIPTIKTKITAICRPWLVAAMKSGTALFGNVDVSDSTTSLDAWEVHLRKLV